MPAKRGGGEEMVFQVSELAKRKATRYGRAIGRSRADASRKLVFFTKTILDGMNIGEEERFPIPSSNGRRKEFVLKKLGDERLSIQIR